MVGCILQGTINEPQGTINEPKTCSHTQATVSDSQETKTDTVMQSMNFTKNLSKTVPTAYISELGGGNCKLKQ